MLRITDSAVSQLRKLLQDQGRSEGGAGLRLMVERGGCAGLQYAMKIAQPEPGDEVFERDGVRFIVPAPSIPYLRGCQIDFVDTLNDSGFRITNPNAARSCGCGTSFEPVTADAASAAAALPEGEACLTERLS